MGTVHDFTERWTVFALQGAIGAQLQSIRKGKLGFVNFSAVDFEKMNGPLRRARTVQSIWADGRGREDLACGSF
jgi:hypothetical protein